MCMALRKLFQVGLPQGIPPLYPKHVNRTRIQSTPPFASPFDFAEQLESAIRLTMVLEESI